MGSPQTWALHGGSVCVCVEATHYDGTADLVMGHKGFAKFTVGCHTLRRMAAVNT